MRRTRLLATLSLSILAACADTEDTNPAPLPATSTAPSASSMPSATSTGTTTTMPPATSITMGSDPYTLVVDAKAMTLTLQRSGQTLTTMAADSLALGSVTTLDDNANYDPYPFLAKVPGAKMPQGLAFLTPTAETLDPSSTSTHAIVALIYPNQVTATLDLTVADAGSFTAKLTPTGDALAMFQIETTPQANEGFYGLGEYYDHVEHHGQIRAMQLEVDGKVESGYNDAHVPVPFLVGASGWGLFVESPYPGAFDVESTDPTKVAATFGTGLHTTDGLTFHLFAAQTGLDVTGRYYAVAGGSPLLPARWALGPWLWRDENKDQAQFVADLHSMRDLDLAHSAIWIDRPYATGVQTFDFLPSQFPDIQTAIQTAHDLGFRMALWHAPYEDQKDPSTAALYQEATSEGYYAPTEGLLLNKWGPLLDLTNPDAYAWWQSHIETYTSMGIEGFKLDYGEDVVPGLPGVRDIWKFHDGSDERTMHSRFPLLYHRIYAETVPKTGGFLLCRHGSYGDQANVSVVWPGDLDSSFAHRFDKVTNADGSTYVAVGGLPASIIAGMSLGPSGFPFFGADTGGYRNLSPTKELFTRWFEQTSVSTVMQIGNGASTVAWEPDTTTGYDMEMLGWYRTYTRLHVRLFPYEWTYAQQLATTGRAIERPLGLAYPSLGVHPDDEYLFGDNLLVAPVVTEGATSRSVLFPPGNDWIDWWTGEVHQGGATDTVNAPLGTLPLFLAQGGIVPLLRPTIDTLSPTTMPDEVDSYATTPGAMWPRIYPGPASTFVLFDGAMVTQEQKSDGEHVTLDDGNELAFGSVVEILNEPKMPSAVSEGGSALTMAASMDALNGANEGWLYVADNGGSVLVKVPSGHREIVVSM